MSRSGASARRFAVVSWSGALPLHLSPRGQRTEAHLRALELLGEVERVGPNRISRFVGGDSSRHRSSLPRRFVRGLVAMVLIDKYEPGAWRALWRWEPQVDFAVLIGYPMSPLPLAARRLARCGVPYVVDLGDPWVLNNPYPTGSRFLRWRGRHQEPWIWRKACGVVVTTAAQGEELRRLYPQLSVLVRPNGFTPTNSAVRPLPAPPRRPNELRLVHYGSLYGPRVDFRAVFERLLATGRWERITLVQYGGDWEDVLAAVPAGVEVDHRSPLPWDQVVAGASEFDAAVVIGWANRAKLPSKAIQYLTLPIPRLAFVNGGGDALSAYVADKPGWAIVEDVEGDPGRTVAGLIGYDWPAAELAPPSSESWASVRRRLAEFVDEMSSASATADGAASSSPAVGATGTSRPDRVC
jgi:glycosyltransferase involved in cell wall biosynthesis